MLRRLHVLLIAVLPLLASCGSSGDTYFARGSKRGEGQRASDGTEHGPWTYRYVTGQVREQGSWDHGRKTGIWTQWYSSGQRHSTGERRWSDEFLGAPREGSWTFWYSNGELRARGQFDDGHAEGEWHWWNHLGELDPKRSGIYSRGERVDGLTQ